MLPPTVLTVAVSGALFCLKSRAAFPLQRVCNVAVFALLLIICGLALAWTSRVRVWRKTWMARLNHFVGWAPSIMSRFSRVQTGGSNADFQTQGLSRQAFLFLAVGGRRAGTTSKRASIRRTRCDASCSCPKVVSILDSFARYSECCVTRTSPTVSHRRPRQDLGTSARLAVAAVGDGILCLAQGEADPSVDSTIKFWDVQSADLWLDGSGMHPTEGICARIQTFNTKPLNLRFLLVKFPD